jgi:hypothetical protein
MKKTFLALAFIGFAGSGAFAQKTLDPAQPKSDKTPTVQTDAAKTPSTTIKFKEESHDFGTLQEGDPAVAEFVFKNTGKEPLIIQNVHPSCGCTVPSWSKEPVAPGKKGVIKASYGTKGRVGNFNKSVTVTSTAGTTVLHIKCVVKWAPESSAPKSESMLKTK